MDFILHRNRRTYGDQLCYINYRVFLISAKDFFSYLKIKETKKIGKLRSRNVFCFLLENRPCKSVFIIPTMK